MVKIEVEIDDDIARNLELLAAAGDATNRKLRLTMRMAEALVEGHSHTDGSECAAHKAVANLQEAYAASVRTALALKAIVDAYKATDEGKAAFAEPQPGSPSEQFEAASV